MTSAANKKTLALYAETSAHKARVVESKKIISSALKAVPQKKWYVAFSGGKDSTVLFSLVREYYSQTPGLWGDDEFYLPETFRYINRVRASGAKIIQIKNKVIHTDWFISNAECNADPAYLKYSGAFTGLRAQENSYRRKYLRKYGALYNSKKKGWLCNPLAWWKTIDIWAYIYSRKIDYNSAYDRLSEIGVELEHQRIGPYATEKALGYGQMAILKKGWPDEYQRFVKKFPQAGAYT